MKTAPVSLPSALQSLKSHLREEVIAAVCLRITWQDTSSQYGTSVSPFASYQVTVSADLILKGDFIPRTCFSFKFESLTVKSSPVITLHTLETPSTVTLLYPVDRQTDRKILYSRCGLWNKTNDLAISYLYCSYQWPCATYNCIRGSSIHTWEANIYLRFLCVCVCLRVCECVCPIKASIWNHWRMFILWFS